ncbi:MAG TPA: 5-amino-6-(D-ribitylamino)uracil--L-tyrosine 4-hydroxyphenyl transferase CofH [Actinomycetota bacterium]|nr:5-amino-6-(D-ribitylamino)uracil--L-tyrosine 4-hydroxyphenyl transferase CofH [Actinomycetota bacterium]
MTPLERGPALELAGELASGHLPKEARRDAAAIRDVAFGNVVTYSPKVFIPLTMLCRDVCHYCTFARPPLPGRRAYMTLEEVRALAVQARAAGCAEALFTLGDKPELRYRTARDELEAMGFESTLDYLVEAAHLVLTETGLLPHLNPGVLSAEQLLKLKDVSASMGMMLESASVRLTESGMPHHGSPDKDPEARLATLDAAGESRVPFTTGILIGIGETWEERAESLLEIQQSHQRWGHVQEVIVQNFRAKDGTPMHAHPEPSLQDMIGTIVLARLILDSEISVQVPPNLAWGTQSLVEYLQAGINDWGGVSPVTIDHVNPEAPWPQIERLREVTEDGGFLLAPRLTVYPRYINGGWISRKVEPSVLKLADTSGLLRDFSWHPGIPVAPPDVVASPWLWSGRSGVKRRRDFDLALAKAARSVPLNEDEVTVLFTARGPEFSALIHEADAMRREVSGDTVTFVITRNINYTNMCYFKCGFCAFSKGPKSLNLRGDPYLLSLEEIGQRAKDAWDRGATEVCLQGGIHPSFTGDFYVDVVRAVKAAAPSVHVHAFSPLEVWQGAATKGVSVRYLLEELKDNGLGTLPGTAAEVLDDEVRKVICPDKISTEQWSFVAKTAHSLGLRMTTTIMFGHADSYRSWARHLLVLRGIQAQTGGFTEFVPLPFVHMAAPIFLKGKARAGPTIEESLKMHAVGRLVLNPLITNIQVSWVKMGSEGAKLALRAGCNDLGGTLMDENISRAAGAAHGQEMTPQAMMTLASELERPWARRNTVYDILEQLQPV